MFAGVVIRLTSTMSSSHSIPSASRMVVGLVSCPCSWPPPASATSCDGSSFIPHFGQWPGSSLTTSGCIGQV